MEGGSLLADAGKEHSWFIAFFKARKEGTSFASFWPQRPPCQCSGLRELAERDTFCSTIVLFCDDCAIDIMAKGFGEVSCSEPSCLPDLADYLHVRCVYFLEPKKKKRDAEGKFVDVETTKNNTLTKAIDQFEQMVIAVEQCWQTLARGTSERALVDNEFKILFENLAQIYKIAVGQCGALAVEGCALPKARNSIYQPFNRPASSTLVGAESGFLQSSGLVHNVALERKLRGGVCGARWSAGCGKFDGPLHDLQGEGR